MLPDDIARRLVEANAEEARMAQLAVHRPLDEADLHDDLRPHPVRAQPREALRARERRRGNLERVEPRTEIEQKLGVESCADLSGKAEVAALEVPDEQRAEPDALALRIGEAADDELLRLLAFHLQPARRSAVLVARSAALRDDAFPSLAPRDVPRVIALERIERLDAPERRPHRQRLQQRLAILERTCRHVLAVEPHDVEDVIRRVFVAPRDLAVEDRVRDREPGDRVRDGGNVLRQSIARVETDLGSLL